MEKQRIQSFGRRLGRGLTESKKQAISIINNYAVSEEDFSAPNLALEIGFGSGEHLIHRASNNPDTLYIGCEVYIHGVAQAVREVEEKNLDNIRFYTEDARELLDNMPDDSLDIIYILFPDPWPKTRQHKRRIINNEMLHTLHRVLKTGGKLHFATDHPDYANWVMVHMANFVGFEWLADSRADWENPPEGHIKTRYQQKCKANHHSVFLQFSAI